MIYIYDIERSFIMLVEYHIWRPAPHLCSWPAIHLLLSYQSLFNGANSVITCTLDSPTDVIFSSHRRASVCWLICLLTTLLNWVIKEFDEIIRIFINDLGNNYSNQLTCHTVPLARHPKPLNSTVAMLDCVQFSDFSKDTPLYTVRAEVNA